MSSEIKALSERLDYFFKDISFLEAALTHCSVAGENNERLEFLGDSVLNFIIAEALYHKFPAAREGTLSRLRASLVKGEMLAVLAQEFSIGQYLRLGIGEVKSGGAHRESILADAMEAIIGAVFLDSDFETCREKVLSWYEDKIDAVSLDNNLKDPKTCLQEYLQARKLPLPIYTITSVKGESHNQTFYIECRVEGVKHSTQGIGSSRRKAEQEAATKFLAKFYE